MELKTSAFGSACILMVVLTASCGKPEQEESSNNKQNLTGKGIPVTTENLVTAQKVEVAKEIGDETSRFQILNRKALQKKLDDGSVVSKNLTDQINKTTLSEDRLLIGMPVQLMDQEFIFGGAFTKVSNRTDTDFGNLKLTNLEPIHVRLAVVKNAEKYIVALFGCMKNCSELSRQVPLVAIPVAAVAKDSSILYLDVSALGEKLKLFSLLGGEQAFPYIVKSSKTTAVDFSMSTLVFDIEEFLTQKEVTPLGALGGGMDQASYKQEDITLTTRWYLKLGGGLNSTFTARPQVPGVGFFETKRNEKSLITRFSVTSKPSDAAPVHYYILDVPAQWRSAFAKSFEQWNGVFEDTLKRNILTYEFVNADDPKRKLLVTGDVRFNILEWDLVNEATYGGLGPSQASQSTGETFAAHVLIQGPKVIDLYSDWYKVNKTAQDLLAQGETAKADLALLSGTRLLNQKLPKSERLFEINLGDLKLTQPAADEKYEDRIASRSDYIPIPDGYSYEEYMNGYFLDMVTHELGHNLGLRHNFRGNLFADDQKNLVSGSVMEYLGKLQRYKDKIGEYDRMAIEYGYNGVKPKNTNMFCTDEETKSSSNEFASPECSRDDGTADPFGNFEADANRAVDLLVRRGSPLAPEWKFNDVSDFLKKDIDGMLQYGYTAKVSSSEWTNWQPKNGPKRPASPSEIGDYVLDKITQLVCKTAVAGAVKQKGTSEGKAITQKNIDDLRAFLTHELVSFEVTSEHLDCKITAN